MKLSAYAGQMYNFKKAVKKTDTNFLQIEW